MRNYFYGWYFKCQSNDYCFAVIPALHQHDGISTCSIQFISRDGTWNLSFPGDAFQKEKRRIWIGENCFGEDGIILKIHRPELEVEGKLYFEDLHPLKYDIMGPFSCVPFMECRHQLWSMYHQVSGRIKVNGMPYFFYKDPGYWEGDQGRSFPKKYIWTQCHFENGSLMMSVAEIPLCGLSFNGITGVILWEGKEYRIATYLGARIEYIAKNQIIIRQGKYRLEIRLKKKNTYKLKAPVSGRMNREVREGICCNAFYRFSKAGKTLFSFDTEEAAFEYEFR